MYFNDIEYYFEDAEDCIYIRVCEIELTNFMENLVETYQEELLEDHENNESIHIIIKRFFDLYDLHWTDLNNNDSSLTIVEIIKNEVFEFFGGNCWDHAEMYINDLSFADREKIEFRDLVEILHGYCLDYS